VRVLGLIVRPGLLAELGGKCDALVLRLWRRDVGIGLRMRPNTEAMSSCGFRGIPICSIGEECDTVG